jgi:hypothetical protein
VEAKAMKNLLPSYTGKVINGVIVLEADAILPEGTGVKVELLDEQPTAASPLGELLLKYAGVIDDLPADLAKNHDHYLYGAPKVDEP